jgi:hypothetical protein
MTWTQTQDPLIEHPKHSTTDLHPYCTGPGCSISVKTMWHYRGSFSVKSGLPKAILMPAFANGPLMLALVGC